QVAVLMAFAGLNRWTLWWHKMQVAQQRSVALAALLKNTGAAMVLVSSMTTESSMILFPILLSTLTQHLLASRICLDPNGEPSRQ
nr:hypothetical protein [Pirellula sp.]